MRKLDDHITEMTNGNSKRLAYYIAIGVLTLILNFTLSIVDRMIESNKTTPAQVYEQVSVIAENQKEEIKLLHDSVLLMRDLYNGQENITKAIERLEK